MLLLGPRNIFEIQRIIHVVDTWMILCFYMYIFFYLTILLYFQSRIIDRTDKKEIGESIMYNSLESGSDWSLVWCFTHYISTVFQPYKTAAIMFAFKLIYLRSSACVQCIPYFDHTIYQFLPLSHSPVRVLPHQPVRGHSVCSSCFQGPLVCRHSQPDDCSKSNIHCLSNILADPEGRGRLRK